MDWKKETTGVTRSFIDDCGTPITKEISGSGTGPDKAAHIIAFIESPPHHLSAQSAGCANDQSAGRTDRSARRHGCCLCSRIGSHGYDHFASITPHRGAGALANPERIRASFWPAHSPTVDERGGYLIFFFRPENDPTLVAVGLRDVPSTSRQAHG